MCVFLYLSFSLDTVLIFRYPNFGLPCEVDVTRTLSVLSPLFNTTDRTTHLIFITRLVVNCRYAYLTGVSVKSLMFHHGLAHRLTDQVMTFAVVVSSPCPISR